MGDPQVSEGVSRGERALAMRDWEAAVSAFEAVLAKSADPIAHDGLGRASWWLRNVDKSVTERTAAYVGFRRQGQHEHAVRVALWLAREYSDSMGDSPVSRGWLARAEGLVSRLPPGVEHGWLAATRGLLRVDPAAAEPDARTALDVARTTNDSDLEATALALLGLATIAAGRVVEGMTFLDEAMVVVTAGEVSDPMVFGDVCCLVTRAAEEAGDSSRLAHWDEIIMRFMKSTGHPALLEFCGTCCAQVLLATGHLASAEGWLLRTLRELERGQQRSRCVHPAAKLAELRLLQGRVEEAGRLLAGFEDRADALRAAAAVRLGSGDTAVAASLLHRRLRQVGDGLVAVPVLALLIDVQLAQGNHTQAQETSRKLDDVAQATNWPRAMAAAELAGGKVATATGDMAHARERCDRAISTYDELHMRLDGARARIALSEALHETDPTLAAHEAGIALDVFDAAGATGLADNAANLLRTLGGPARTGPKAVGLLSRRERQVLVLLAEGLTNTEIAARLFISTKTAEHHVSSILAKLHVRNRSEAIAFALRDSAPV